MPEIKLAQLSRTGQHQITVAFQYHAPIAGFDHAMILLVEQDGSKDRWTTTTRPVSIAGHTIQVVDFANASYPGGVNTSGPEDDVGGRGAQRRLRVVPTTAGWTTAVFQFAPWQPDTDPGPDLEFYGLVSIVAVAGGHPVAQLGNLVVTPTLKVTF